MIDAITIQRDGKKRDDGEVLDGLEKMVKLSKGKYSSPTHAAIMLIRQSEEFQYALSKLQAKQPEPTAAATS